MWLTVLLFKNKRVSLKVCFSLYQPQQIPVSSTLLVGNCSEETVHKLSYSSLAESVMTFSSFGETLTYNTHLGHNTDSLTVYLLPKQIHTLDKVMSLHQWVMVLTGHCKQHQMNKWKDFIKQSMTFSVILITFQQALKKLVGND